MSLFQAIFVPTCALIAVLTLVRSFRGGVSRRSGLLRFVIWAAASFLIAFPSMATQVAQGLGIGRGADLVLYVAILAGLGASLFFYGRYRNLERMVTELLRREALGGARRGESRRDSEAPQPATHTLSAQSTNSGH